jgi:hypothetical protein|tara:strand:- start:772 stop:1248 length:477 start_codon:yes stop_codon:yes gene_type:complete
MALAFRKLINDVTKIVKQSPYENGLAALLVAYIVLNIKTPGALTGVIDSTLGNVVVVVIALSLFHTKNPVLIVLGIVAAYEIIRRSSVSTGSYAIEHSLASDKKKAKAMKEYNQPTAKSLEEEMVSSIPPMSSSSVTPAGYSESLTRSHGATTVSEVN